MFEFCVDKNGKRCVCFSGDWDAVKLHHLIYMIEFGIVGIIRPALGVSQ